MQSCEILNPEIVIGFITREKVGITDLWVCTFLILHFMLNITFQCLGQIGVPIPMHAKVQRISLLKQRHILYSAANNR